MNIPRSDKAPIYSNYAVIRICADGMHRIDFLHLDDKSKSGSVVSNPIIMTSQQTVKIYGMLQAHIQKLGLLPSNEEIH